MFPRLKSAAIALVALCALTTGSARADLLHSSVQFDSTTGDYTYSYMLDNTSGALPISELAILIDSSKQDFEGTLAPAAHDQPLGWAFWTAVSGASANPPLNEFGTFWTWFNGPGVLPGETQTGFSFTTHLAPSPGLANNYFLYSQSDGGQILEYGHIAAPDFALPEPHGLVVLGLSAAALLGRALLRRQRGLPAV